MNTAKIRRKSREVILFIILGSLVLSSFGCFSERKEQAQALVKDGSMQSEKLTEYYSRLKQMRQAHLQLTGFELRRTGSPLKPSLVQAYTDQFAALEARANMARKLNTTYVVLGKLIDYDAPGEITASVIDLKKAIEDVSKKKLSFPGVLGGVDPEIVLKKATNALVSWIQIKQFNKNALKAEDVLDGIANLFNAEKPIYVQISQDYYNIVRTHNLFMSDNGQINAVSGFDKFAEVYGLKLNPMQPPQPPQPPSPLNKANQTEQEKNEYLAKMLNFERQYKQYETNFRKYSDYLTLLKENMKETMIQMSNNFNEASIKEADELSGDLFALKRAHQDFTLGRKAKTD